MSFRKAFLFGILSLFSVASTTGAEQFQKEDFEAVVKRGYYNFLDAVGQEKSSELGLEDPTERKTKEKEKPIVETKLTIPLAAQGHEAVYQRFLNGVLIYRPNQGSDVGVIKLPIASLANPLEGTFDLSQCGDTGNYLSISTGYRKEKKAENSNKVEIWFTPRFLIEKELGTTAAHFKVIMDNWKHEQAPVGMFWTWGGWDNLGWYDYLTTENMENLSKSNLHKNYEKTGTMAPCIEWYGGSKQLKSAMCGWPSNMPHAAMNIWLPKTTHERTSRHELFYVSFGQLSATDK